MQVFHLGKIFGDKRNLIIKILQLIGKTFEIGRYNMSLDLTFYICLLKPLLDITLCGKVWVFCL